MSVYIPGISMPKSCFKCKMSSITTGGWAWCRLTGHAYPPDDPPSSSCPLVPVPDHGRLVDKDTVCAECRRVAEEYDGIYPDCTYCPIHIAPTIIPATAKEDKE